MMATRTTAVTLMLAKAILGTCMPFSPTSLNPSALRRTVNPPLSPLPPVAVLPFVPPSPPWSVEEDESLNVTWMRGASLCGTNATASCPDACSSHKSSKPAYTPP